MRARASAVARAASRREFAFRHTGAILRFRRHGGDFAISPNGGDERFKTTRATRTTAETRARPLGDDGAR
jgi:hypothetical protein